MEHRHPGKTVLWRTVVQVDNDVAIDNDLLQDRQNVAKMQTKREKGKMSRSVGGATIDVFPILSSP